MLIASIDNKLHRLVYIRHDMLYLLLRALVHVLDVLQSAIWVPRRHAFEVV
jgi:hypothetical protein